MWVYLHRSNIWVPHDPHHLTGESHPPLPPPTGGSHSPHPYPTYRWVPPAPTPIPPGRWVPLTVLPGGPRPNLPGGPIPSQPSPAKEILQKWSTVGGRTQDLHPITPMLLPPGHYTTCVNKRARFLLYDIRAIDGPGPMAHSKCLHSGQFQI
jgi:hypothetical protein